MSIYGPAPVQLSKLKYHILKRVTDPEEQKAYLEKLGPFPEFRLRIKVRSLLTDGTTTELSDDEVVSVVKEPRGNLTDCIDTILFAHTRAKKHIDETYQNPAIVTLSIQYTYPEMQGWTDTYQDEFPINVKFGKLPERDQDEKILTLINDEPTSL